MDKVNKTNQKAYIEYLEQRLAKLSQSSFIENEDLDKLTDTQNEVTVSNIFCLKKALNDCTVLARQNELLQNQLEISNEFISYLIESFWWKATQPFRLVSRHLDKHKTYQPFDFSEMPTITEPVKIVIYVNRPNPDELQDQLANIAEQTGLTDIKLAIIDFNNSDDAIIKIAKKHNIAYVNTLVAPDSMLIAKQTLKDDAKYVVYIKQGLVINSNQWLHQMVCPLTKNYTSLSALYDKTTSQIEKVKAESFYNELKTRIFSIGRYDCLLLPHNRNKTQYIPPMVTSEALAVAKRCN